MLTCYSEIEDFTRKACKEISEYSDFYRILSSKRRTTKRRLERLMLTTRTELRKNIQAQLVQMKKHSDTVSGWIDFSSKNFKGKYYPGLSIDNAEKQFAEVWSKRFVADDAEAAILEQSKHMANYKHLCTAMLHVEKEAKKALDSMQ